MISCDILRPKQRHQLIKVNRDVADVADQVVQTNFIAWKFLTHILGKGHPILTNTDHREFREFFVAVELG